MIAAQPGRPLLPPLAAVSGLEVAAGILLLLALAALVLALVAAAREPGGLRAVFGLRPREDASSAADELRILTSEARTLAEDLADKFDERAAALARLLREAEREATRLERTIDTATRSGARDAGFTNLAGTTAAPSSSMFSEAKPGARAGMSPIGDAGDPMTREIYRLADEGLPPVEIASRLGQHTGKVELILALRPT